MQSKRHLRLDTPLGENALLVRRLDGEEHLSQPFRLELELLSDDGLITPNDLLGQNVTITIDLADGERHFNGFVRQFGQYGYDGQFARYRAVVVPWLWFLSRTADCRIFQDQSVPDIVKAVFREHGFTDFEESLTGHYETFEYIVQYRESDLAFVSRLMEHEGIYFFFRHDKSHHVLVLADGYDAHAPCAGYEETPYYPPDEQRALREAEYLWDWQLRQHVEPGAYALNAYDFKAPKKNLRTVANMAREHAYAEYEVYDYPGGYTEVDHGDRYSQIRIEEQQADHQIAYGEGNPRGLFAGGLTTLTNHPRDDQNLEYLITSVSHHAESDPMDTGGDIGSDEFYRCSLTAMDARTPYRPPRLTPKPRVYGPQTAVVVGKSGQDIWTDKYGRVKVQFHWDREGKSDENSSCWVRVSQNWAGKNWGGMFMPHIGHEVVVSFLEGDPDRPLITGRIYNADNMPPLELPTHRTKSVLRDYGNNHMIWEGDAGKQFIRIKQDCGNMLEMDGTPGKEHTEITDKFGNHVLLDSVGEMLSLWSPSGSGMIMRESIHMLTNKNWYDFKAGTTAKAQVGHETSGYAGSKLSLTVGDNFGAYLGSKTSVAVNHAFEANYGQKFSYSSESQYAKTDANNTVSAKKDATVEGGQNVWILGGGDDEALINGKGNALTLSYSASGLGRSEVSDLGKGPLLAPATSLISSLVALGSQYAQTPSPVEKPELDEAPAQKDPMDKLSANYEGVLSGLVSGFGQMGLGAARASAMEKQADSRQNGIKQHSSPDAQVQLKEDGAEIKAGSAKITISKDGDIKVSSDKTVTVSGKNINVAADATVNISGGISHNNLSVKKR